MSRPQLVILDGYTLNPGDLSWADLEALADCTIYDRTPPDLTLERSRNAELLLTNKTRLPREIIEQLPDVRFISLMSTGYDVVDVATARERGIPVSNVPAYSTESVAQAVFALLLELTHRVGHHNEAVHAGRWSSNVDWTFWDGPIIELNDQVMGIVGFGRIGQAVARRAQAFGMQVLVHTRTVPDPSPEGVQFVDLDTLFQESDVVSLHTPLTPETRHLIDRKRLATMKPTALLINTGRGPLIDEPALAEALRSDQLAGAGLDVLSTEPPPHDHPLFGIPNCIITPHYAWGSRAARQRLLDTVVANVKAFLDGEAQNVVNQVS